MHIAGLTHAVCDEGIPPEPTTLVTSHRRSVYQYVSTLRLCASRKAKNAATKGLHQTWISFAAEVALQCSTCIVRYPATATLPRMMIQPTVEPARYLNTGPMPSSSCWSSAATTGLPTILLINAISGKLREPTSVTSSSRQAGAAKVLTRSCKHLEQQGTSL